MQTKTSERSAGIQCLCQCPGLTLCVFQQRRFATQCGIAPGGFGGAAGRDKPGEQFCVTAPSGNLNISGSENRLYKNGRTAASESGPPRLNSTTAVTVCHALILPLGSRPYERVRHVMMPVLFGCVGAIREVVHVRDLRFCLRRRARVTRRGHRAGNALGRYTGKLEMPRVRRDQERLRDGRNLRKRAAP